MEKLLVKTLIQNRRDQLNSYVLNLADDFLDTLDGIDYISDAVHYTAEDSIDIDYFSLRKWLYENETEYGLTYPVSLMEDAVNEGLIDTCGYDLYSHIQIAQCLGFEEILNGNLPSLLLIKALQIASETREEITEDELEGLENLDFKSLSTVDSLKALVASILESEDEE